ncbi:hypothetical protein HON52_04175 [Candidatus Uhrbacteria bacterium]|nr:hypothetical protein [Candidatus Uhrbacteria bacterium]
MTPTLPQVFTGIGFALLLMGCFGIIATILIDGIFLVPERNKILSRVRRQVIESSKASDMSYAISRLQAALGWMSDNDFDEAFPGYYRHLKKCHDYLSPRIKDVPIKQKVHLMHNQRELENNCNWVVPQKMYTHRVKYADILHSIVFWSSLIVSALGLFVLIVT